MVKRDHKTFKQEQYFENRDPKHRWAIPYDTDAITHNEYVQKVLSTYMVPELAGKHPPRFPGEEPVDPKDLPN